MNTRGAKTAMAVALRARAKISNLIPVDNAPVDAALKSDFAKYIQAMRRIEDARVKRQAEADEILKDYEEVCNPQTPHCPPEQWTNADIQSPFPSANSS